MSDTPENAADPLAELRAKETKLRALMEAYRVQPASNPDRANFVAAIGDFVLSGLGLYLEAAAKDRESAEKDRLSAAQDRISMNRFTRWIAIATIVTAVMTIVSAVAGGFVAWGTVRMAKASPSPPVPIVNIAAPLAPIINIQPAPVILNSPAVRARPGRRKPSSK